MQGTVSEGHQKGVLMRTRFDKIHTIFKGHILSTMFNMNGKITLPCQSRLYVGRPYINVDHKYTGTHSQNVQQYVYSQVENHDLDE